MLYAEPVKELLLIVLAVFTGPEPLLKPVHVLTVPTLSQIQMHVAYAILPARNAQGLTTINAPSAQ